MRPTDAAICRAGMTSNLADRNLYIGHWEIYWFIMSPSLVCYTVQLWSQVFCRRKPHVACTTLCVSGWTIRQFVVTCSVACLSSHRYKFLVRWWSQLYCTHRRVIVGCNFSLLDLLTATTTYYYDCFCLVNYLNFIIISVLRRVRFKSEEDYVESKLCVIHTVFVYCTSCT